MAVGGGGLAILADLCSQVRREGHVKAVFHDLGKVEAVGEVSGGGAEEGAGNNVLPVVPVVHDAGDAHKSSN